MEILVLHPGALGDIILSLPAIALLRRQYPQAKITLAGNTDHLKSIAQGYADRVVALSSIPLHRLYAPEVLPPDDLRFWKSYDRIVSWTGSGNAEFVRRLKEANLETLVAPWHPVPEERRHVSQLFADSLAPWIPSNRGVTPTEILLDSPGRLEGERWLLDRAWNDRDCLLALHCGAGSAVKRWPLARFLCIARRFLHHAGKRILVVEGPAELGPGRQVLQSLEAPQVILAESVPTSLLGAILERCQVFVGNDSGVAHLAAGLGVRCVVLFGPTSPQHWAPLGQHVVTLRDSRACQACGSDPGSEHTCLSNISAESVWEQLAD